jgi:putative ATP-binding cassette transporter
VIAHGERACWSRAIRAPASAHWSAIVGLWAWGKGKVQIEKGARVLLMSQRAYVPVGTLRRAVTYPLPAEDKTVDEIAGALKLVGLEHLVERIGEKAPWDQILLRARNSGFAFARILLHRPTIVMLDEATSALDPESQGT